MLKQSPATRQPPSRDELRKFGFVFAVGLLVIFDLLLPWFRYRVPPLWPLYIALPGMLSATVYPQALRGPYRAWTRFGEIVGFINTRIILGIVFFALLTPLAWLFRLRGRDLLARRFDRSADSYRTVSAAADTTDMEKPY